MSEAALGAVALWAGLHLILTLALALNVTRHRARANQGVGPGDDPVLARAVRAHGNNIEYVPGALLALLVVALTGLSGGVIHACGGLLFLARLLHAHGIQQLDRDLPPTRVAGNILTWLIYLGLGVTLVVRGL